MTNWVKGIVLNCADVLVSLYIQKRDPESATNLVALLNRNLAGIKDEHDLVIEKVLASRG